MTSIADSSSPMSLCANCRDHIAEIGTVLLHPQPLSALPAEFNGEFLVIVACDKQRWWDIAWRHGSDGIVDGAWRYAAGIADAEPIAWCPLPAPDLIPKCGC